MNTPYLTDNKTDYFSEPIHIDIPEYPDLDLIVGADGTRYIRRINNGLVNDCMRFMKLVISTTDKFHQRLARGAPAASQSVSPIGQHLKFLPGYARVYRAGHSYHPLIRFFLEHYREHPISYHTKMSPGALYDGQQPFWRLFDDFLGHLRKEATRQCLKRAVNEWQRKFDKNKKRCLDLETQVFARRSRVAVIRIDFGYQKVQLSHDDCKKLVCEDIAAQDADHVAYALGDMNEQCAGDLLTSFEQVQADKDRLIANMKGKPSLFKHLLAYVWRIEHAAEAGFHIHFAFFFNGSDVLKHEWLAQQICQYWVTTVTKGRGRAHNCNASWKPTSKDYGIGMVSSYEDDKRMKLRTKVLAYLCKEEQPVHVLPYKGCKLFGSHFYQADNSKGRGRPRIRHANQVVGGV